MSATAKLSSASTGMVAPPAATDDSASWIEAEKACDGDAIDLSQASLMISISTGSCSS